MNIYETVRAEYDEHIRTADSVLEFDDWFNEKIKPKDKLFEKWTGFCGEWLAGFEEDEIIVFFKELKKLGIIADNLNGTKGLKEAIKEFEGYGETYVRPEIVARLRAIKSEMEAKS